MIKPLLIEIGCEELPAIPFLNELPNIDKKWADILEEHGLLCEFNFFYTPRRLVLWHREFPLSQEDKEEELWGPPLDIALKDSNPTGAGTGFAKKCGVAFEELSTNTKGNREFLYYKRAIKGQKSADLLNTMINKFLHVLHFGKSMRWASNSESFIRPIRFLGVMLGEEVAEAEVFGVRSSNVSYGLRTEENNRFEYTFAGDYFCKLDKAGVVLYQDERKQLILDQFKQIETEHGLSIDIDEELLAEIVAITEYPQALLGSFDEKFLKLPDEVILLSMKEHQRYFGCYKHETLANNFIVVCNAKTDDYGKIIAGNEKVLRARLSDGLFFYENDLRSGLSAKGLEDINYVQGLGSIYDKVQREKKIALLLLKQYEDKFENKENLKELLEEAVELSKADLLTEVVYEFTELQGIMGYYYAKAAQKNERVYCAIKEQYLPDGEESGMPSNLFSSLVAMSNKIDTLCSLFSIGKIPKGSGDPFALRRAAAGIVKIAIEQDLKFDFSGIIEDIANMYKPYDRTVLNEFFIDRLYQIFGFNKAVIKSVLVTGENDLVNIYHKCLALNNIVASDDFRQYVSTFKRVANIIKDIELDRVEINESLFEQSEEKELYKKFKEVEQKNIENFELRLDKLFGLKPELDTFFDKVFVNHENLNIRTNRKNLIGLIYLAFKDIADIKEITL
jgi:glycyl-tRNA synthetase beta chain